MLTVVSLVVDSTCTENHYEYDKHIIIVAKETSMADWLIQGFSPK